MSDGLEHSVPVLFPGNGVDLGHLNKNVPTVSPQLLEKEINVFLALLPANVARLKGVVVATRQNKKTQQEYPAVFHHTAPALV